MIKKISVSQLRVGMYIDNLDSSWMEHNFVRTRFAVDNPRLIEKIAANGLKHVYIDTTKGLDVESAPTKQEVEHKTQQRMEKVARAPQTPKQTMPPARVSVAEEGPRARKIFTQANGVVRNLMSDIRLGKQVEVEAIEPLAESMVSSVMRSPHALSSVTRLKTKDEYTFMHSVSVSALMISFARAMHMSETDIMEIAKGALLHDIGKILVPDTILNKPGKLTDDEFEQMKLHVVKSDEILRETTGISAKALEAVSMHHERVDGSGYPLRLKGDEISTTGQMSAVVDVYDALTSVRVYKDGWEPSLTLKKMLEWSPNHFDTQMVHQFIRCLGIYPVGSLVLLSSGRVAIVREQNEDLLRPTVEVIYHAQKQRYLQTREQVVLTDNQDERVERFVTPAEYGLKVENFI